MATPTHSVTISQTGDDLNIAAAPYEMVSWRPPALEHRIVEVQGRYQAGARLVSAVPDVATIGGVFRCMGDDWDDVDDAVNAMYFALQQFEYTVTVVIAGVSEVFTNCQPATIRPVNAARTSGEVVSGFADYEIAIRCTPNIGTEGS